MCPTITVRGLKKMKIMKMKISTFTSVVRYGAKCKDKVWVETDIIQHNYMYRFGSGVRQQYVGINDFDYIY